MSQRLQRGPRLQAGMPKHMKVSTDIPSHRAASSRLRKRLGGMGARICPLRAMPSTLPINALTGHGRNLRESRAESSSPLRNGIARLLGSWKTSSALLSNLSEPDRAGLAKRNSLFKPVTLTLRGIFFFRNVRFFGI